MVFCRMAGPMCPARTTFCWNGELYVAAVEIARSSEWRCLNRRRAMDCFRSNRKKSNRSLSCGPAVFAQRRTDEHMVQEGRTREVSGHLEVMVKEDGVVHQPAFAVTNAHGAPVALLHRSTH